VLLSEFLADVELVKQRFTSAVLRTPVSAPASLAERVWGEFTSKPSEYREALAQVTRRDAEKAELRERKTRLMEIQREVRGLGHVGDLTLGPAQG
jgi:hypothetical protein